MKKIYLAVFILIIFLSWVSTGFAYSRMPEYLCELGIKFFQQGRYDEALHEFRKALIVQPNYEPALRYIEMTERIRSGPVFEPEAIATPGAPVTGSATQTVEEYLDLVEIQREMIREKQPEKPKILGAPSEAYGITTPALPAASREALIKKKTSIPRELNLDESLSQIRQPIEIEQQDSIIIRGVNIQRFLVTQPDYLTVERMGPNEISVSGKNLGYTYVHIWDNTGRRTLEFLTIPPRPLGPTLEEEMRMEEEKARNFKLRYYLDWSSFETGRRLDSLKRTSYSWRHSLGFFGETPYGMFDSSVSAITFANSTDVNYMAVGLTEGKLGDFKDFSVRLLDYTPTIANLILWGGNLRGAMFYSPVFHKKLDYTVFWGREGGGIYGGFSPGFATTRDSYLGGVDIKFKPQPKQYYNVAVVRGWGSERFTDLHEYGYDANFNINFDKGSFGSDVAFDSQRVAYLLNTSYSRPGFNLNSEFRNIDRNFRTMTGLGSRTGELGLLTNMLYRPWENLNLTSRIDLYKDRLFPNAKNSDTWNEDLNLGASLQTGPLTSWRFDYNLQNDLGKIAAMRTHNAGIGLNRSFEWIRRINTYLMYRYYFTRNYSAPNLDYINNRVLAGLSFSLIKDLNYFINQELGWVDAFNTGETAQPRAFQTGIDYYKQILKSPFHLNLRLMYRDEENAQSTFSFLSGEDYVEGYTELSYKPKPDVEAFFNTRVRNVWAENPDTRKYIDVNFYSGLRYIWDTGLSWESIGAIEGYVFKDLNSDGLRQRDEPPVEGVRVWLGKDKSQVTDLFGYYRFGKVKARKAHVNIDTGTLPSGFSLTVPATQEASISQAKVIRINFGVLSKTEVIGIIFEDRDGRGELSSNSIGLKGVQVYLEDGSKATTDDYGRYIFKKLSLGRHRLTLDLKTVPPVYIPTVPIFLDFELSEGQSFSYNIPLKKTE